MLVAINCDEFDLSLFDSGFTLSFEFGVLSF